MSRFFRFVPWVLGWIGLAVLPGSTAQGQTASLVADLNTTGQGSMNFQPRFLVAADGKLFFNAVDASSNTLGLWATDGTPAGPELLCGEVCGQSPPLGVLGGAMLFAQSFNPIWRSDGTRVGTFPLAGSDATSGYLPLGGKLYFQHCGEQPTCGLYQTDGTVAGTGPVDTVDTGYPSTGIPAEQALAGSKIYFLGRSGGADVLRVYAAGSGGSAVVAVLPGAASVLTGVGNRLFFLAPAAASQPAQIWTSDGTPAGTAPVAAGPPAFTSPGPFHPAAGRVYFAASDSANGRQIWTSDGTAAGTRRVTGIHHATVLEIDFDAILAVVGRNLAFLVTDAAGARELWATSGTPESTLRLTAAKVVVGYPFVNLYPAGDHLLFAVTDQTGQRLWSTDGTPAGTGVFRGLCSGDCTLLTPLAPGTHGFYLAARDPHLGTALYQTDGTGPGTRRVTPYGAPDFPDVPLLTVAEEGSRTFFFVYPSGHPELWVSDAGGTRLVHDLQGPAPSADPEHLTALGNRLFFTACDGSARDLWRTEGSADTTVRLAPLAGVDCHAGAADDFAKLVATSNALYLLSPLDGKLVRTDGTAAGTVELATLPGLQSVVPALFLDHPWFALEDDTGPSPRVSLWTSDGTPAGTVPALSLPVGVSGLSDLTAVGGALYWNAFEPGLRSSQLWRSDGTQAGTRKITSFTGPDQAVGLTQVGSSLYFVLHGGNSEGSLWKTDGTLFGTSLVVGADVIGQAHDLRELNGALYFLSFESTPTSPTALLWRSDGTAAGTVLLRTFAAATGAETMVVFAGRLFLVVDDGQHGPELWASDGTAAGTVLVRDIAPGPVGSRPLGLTAAANRLFFSADDGVHGRELWTSDGTAAGTRLVEDLAPELPSSSPAGFTATADRLYFAADDGFRGRELWALPLAGAGNTTGCLPTDPHLCLNGNRFQVEITWTDFQGNTGMGHAVALTADTGYFWFFDPANVETVVKVLDARALDGAFWVFYGALSSVRYTMTVTDTQTGLTRRYENLAGQLASVGDTAGFGPLGAYAARTVTPSAAAPAWTAARSAVVATPCIAGPTRLCLQGNRFAVEAAWKDFQGNTGTGTAIPLSGDTGYFWFFAPTNVEVVAKVLDGRALGGKFWFFYGALSNVEYTLTVTDTETGAVKTYKNPSGQFASVADTSAF